MNAFESYQMCPNEELQKHLKAIDNQCSSALEHYQSLLAQRGLVLEVLGIRLVEVGSEPVAAELSVETAAVA